MKSSQNVVIIFLVAFLFSGCSEKSSTSETEITLESKEHSLEDFFVRLNEAATAGDKNAYVNLFLPEGSLFLPNRPPLEGREAIGDWFEKYRNKITQVTDTYERESIDIIGDVDPHSKTQRRIVRNVDDL